MTTDLLNKPETFDRDFICDSLLGEGGMGKVFRARQIALDRFVALKILSKNTDSVQVDRFHREARAAARLVHPNIIQIYTVNTFEGSPYIAMEYVEGEDLQNLARSAPDGFSVHEIIEVARCVAKALSLAAENNIVHRDLKPGNIMVTRTGIPKVMDFGLAKNVEDKSGLTMAGTVLGTPAFMSPEQCISKKVDSRSDIYSLGCVVYFMMFLRPPFIGDNVPSTMFQHLYQEAEWPGKIPELETICRKMMAKKPEDRYQTPQDFIQALAELPFNASLAEVSLSKRASEAFEKAQKKRLAGKSAAAVAAEPAAPLQPTVTTPLPNLIPKSRRTSSFNLAVKLPLTASAPAETAPVEQQTAPQASAAAPEPAPAPPPPTKVVNPAPVPPRSSSSTDLTARTPVPRQRSGTSFEIKPPAPPKSSGVVPAAPELPKSSGVVPAAPATPKSSSVVPAAPPPPRPSAVVPMPPPPPPPPSKIVSKPVAKTIARPAKVQDYFRKLPDGRWSYKLEGVNCDYREGLAATLPPPAQNSTSGLGDCLLCSNFSKRFGCVIAHNMTLDANMKLTGLKLLVEQCVAYTTAGAFDKAIPLLEEYIRENPDDPFGYRELATLYERPDYPGKDKRRAIVLLQRFLQLVSAHKNASAVEKKRAEERVYALSHQPPTERTPSSTFPMNEGIVFSCFYNSAYFAYGILSTESLLLARAGDVDPETGVAAAEMSSTLGRATTLFRMVKSEQAKKKQQEDGRKELQRLSDLSLEELKADPALQVLQNCREFMSSSASCDARTKITLITIRSSKQTHTLCFSEANIFKAQQCEEFLRRLI